MMRTSFTSYLAFVLSALVTSPAFADPTDYISAPTANILKPAQVNLELLYTEPEEGENTTSFLTEFGITDKIEAGVDFNSIDGDETIEADIKYLFLDPDKSTWGFASGFTKLFSDDMDPFFYVTATRQLGKGSFTAGAGTDGDARAFFGASYPLNSSLTAIGEYFTGDEGFALAGAAYKLNKRVHHCGLVSGIQRRRPRAAAAGFNLSAPVLMP
jgi:hypothetical protein